MLLVRYSGYVMAFEWPELAYSRAVSMAEKLEVATAADWVESMAEQLEVATAADWVESMADALAAKLRL